MPDADDELAGGAVVLHVVVGLPHLLQAVVDSVHGEGQPAGIGTRPSSRSWAMTNVAVCP